MRRAYALLFVALCQCVGPTESTTPTGGGNDGTPGSATAAGSVNGVSLSPATAQFGSRTNQPSPGASQSATASVLLSTDPQACTYYQQGGIRAKNQVLELTLFTDKSGDIKPGTYPFSNSNNSAAQGSGAGLFYDVDENGNETKTPATGGTVTVNSSTNTLLSGTYTATFGSSSLTGRFSAQVCSGLQ